MVPEEESPQEEGFDCDTMTKDEVCFCSDAGVSSTAASPKPIPIPAPVRASVRNQKAVKGCGTKDYPYNLDFALTVHRGRRVSSETCQERRDRRSVSTWFSPCYTPGIGFVSCQARNVAGRYHKVCVHAGSSGSGDDSDCPSDELALGAFVSGYGWRAGSYTNRGGCA